MKLVVLDRDGVINHNSPDYIKNADEWLPIEGSLEAIAQLQQNGYAVAIASNQSGLARGYFTIDDLMGMQDKMNRLLLNVGGNVDAFCFCPHLPSAGCDCRKPGIGMLQDILKRFEAQAADTPFVGDSLCDVQAAVAAGMQPVLVKTGHGEKTLSDPLCPPHVRVFPHLAAFVSEWLAEHA